MRWLTSDCSFSRNEPPNWMVVMSGLRSANACRVDFARGSWHCRAVVKRTIGIAKWCKLIAALAVCAAIPCSGQVLPQLLAEIASLDSDHVVSLYAISDGVDLVLAHDHHASPATADGQSVAPSPSDPAHVVHITSGPEIAKQSASLISGNVRDLVSYFSMPITMERSCFVPRLPLDYSRPPPGEMSISPLHRSTLLLI